MDESQALSALRAFAAERDWEKFHSPENLAKSIAIEAGELLECFQWGETAADAEVRSELADVLTYCYLMADRLGADPVRTGGGEARTDPGQVPGGEGARAEREV